MRGFADAARVALGDTQLRRNLHRATHGIRAKRAAVVGELEDWQELRAAGRAIKQRTLLQLPDLLERFEAAVIGAGGIVHWARDAREANGTIADIVAGHGASSVVKVKSLTTDEIGLNDALARRGIEAIETDLAELICQLAGESSSHILVPAIHKNRAEIRTLFRERLGTADLSDDPADLTEAARLHLRRAFLHAGIAVSGVNFGIAETGTVSVVESEGNGRMCVTLPRVLISVMGIEKLLPTWADLEVFLQLLPRSSTGERMNPYTSMWTGVHRDDGPEEFHLVLLDNGRSAVLADPQGRQALRCIRCSACLNVCPVYERVGGHAYGSIYPGPIGAILTPQMRGLGEAGTLPYASSLCGACYDVCPVGIDIPTVLTHLRARSVQYRTARRPVDAEALAMRALAWVMDDERRFAAATSALRAGRIAARRDGRIGRLPWPLSAWTDARDAPAPAARSFREWWEQERGRPG